MEKQTIRIYVYLIFELQGNHPPEVEPDII